MKKYISYSLLALSSCLLLGACSSSSAPKESNNSTFSQQDSDAKKTLTDKDKNQPTDGSGSEGMEFDIKSDITMEDLIEQLRTDKIITGDAEDISNGVTGSKRAMKIGNAVIIEFDANDLTQFKKVYQAQSVNIQGKDYKITAVNSQFILVMLDDSDTEKAEASFIRSKDGRLIIF